MSSAHRGSNGSFCEAVIRSRRPCFIQHSLGLLQQDLSALRRTEHFPGFTSIDIAARVWRLRGWCNENVRSSLLMSETIDCPKSLESMAERESRRRLLNDPHVAPLSDFVQRIRQDIGRGEWIPFFDPLDGGKRQMFIICWTRPGHGP
jgi:hypothetical protein